MTPPEPLLAASGLRVVRGRREILHGVDVAFSAGQIVALLGPNGAGKSTLLGALSGTLATSAGEITRRGRVATLMQTPGLASRTARANVELALDWWGVARGARRARAEAALERMRALPLAVRPATALSGGEQRRVHLARAVAVEADVLLLDEPFDGLDPLTHEELRNDTVDALRASDAAVVVVLHDRADAWAVADRLIVLIDGSVHAEGTPRELLAAPPTPEVARFLGYDGELRTGDHLVLTRAANVHLDADGPIAATASKVIPTEDGARVRLDTPDGQLWAFDGLRAIRTGEPVRVRLRGAAEFTCPE